MATLIFARREYTKELLISHEATALWKESDSITDALINSHVLEKLSNGDKDAALRAICRSLHQDLKSLEDIAKISELEEKRSSTLSKGRQVYARQCVKPHA